jgi:succinate dehydrogenase / fumarate reductase cytochrome b subunit
VQWYKFDNTKAHNMTTQRPAPVYLNIFRIRFPVGAVTSIAHRISGVLLFLSMPLLVYLLDLSLQGPEGFATARNYLQSHWLRLGSAVLVWSLFHHLLSGIRFLLIDTGTGVGLPQARRSAWVVNIAGIALALAYLGWVL